MIISLQALSLLELYGVAHEICGPCGAGSGFTINPSVNVTSAMGVSAEIGSASIMTPSYMPPLHIAFFSSDLFASLLFMSQIKVNQNCPQAYKNFPVTTVWRLKGFSGFAQSGSNATTDILSFTFYAAGPSKKCQSTSSQCV